MRVQDIMTSHVHTCEAEARATAAARIMWEHDVGAVPVVDAQRRPVGMITDRDLCMALYTRGGSLSDHSVASIMSPSIFSCRDRDPLGMAERVMMDRQIRRLPVIDEAGKLVGVLSLNDIALARTRTPVAKVTERVLGDVAGTLAAICRHRAPDGQARA
jgi:CBS domain-containing protein